MNDQIFEIARILGLSTVAFLVAMLVTPALTHFLYKYKLGKQIRTEGAPIFQKMHAAKAGTPTMGGVLIWGTAMGLAGVLWLTASLAGPNSFFHSLNFVSRSETFLPLATLLLAAVIGLTDDLRGVFRLGAKGGGVGVRTKIGLYTVIAALGAWWFAAKLGRADLYVPFLGLAHIGAWYILWFLFVIVATAFSTNETDGLDGLAGGVMLTAFSALAVIAFLQGRYNLAAFAAVIIGALLAFLWFNIHPARFFMGDTGSMALGLTAGVTAMLTHAELFLPFIMFIPMIESISVIIQRLSRLCFGRKIFASTPIHHHFEALGWPETKVTMRFWIISGVAASLGLVLALISFQLAPV